MCTGIVAVIIAGPWALAYLPLYILATLPGWPIGRALFGRAHPASWVAGALCGYALTCLAFWAVIAAGVPSAAAFVAAWCAATAVTWGAMRVRPPAVALPASSTANTRALVLLLLLVPAVFVFPYKNLGASDAQGNRYYRAYFTADFIWHTALTAELTKFAMPPVNPYLGDRTMQYYWTYFLMPAVVAQEGPGGLRDIESSLKVNALCTGLLFVAALIVATWCASASTAGTVIAVVLAVVAASAEGVYAWWDLVSRGRPLSGLAHLNIDAITAWEFSGLRVDSLVRSMWYNPQHSMSAALGVLAMPVAGLAGAGASLAAVTLAGVALACSTVMNPFIGGLFSLVYGMTVLADGLRSRRVLALLRHSVAAALVGLAVGWCIANDMVEGAAGVVLYGLGGYARNAPVATLLLSLGPLLIPAVLAALWPRHLTRAVWPAIAGTALGLVVFYFVRLSVERSYIGFRAGQLLQLALPGLAAVSFSAMWRRSHRLALAIAATTIAIGLPTTLIDTYNTQDIANRSMGPGGFRWTITITPEEQQAFEWIRTNTSPTAILQMDPIAHGRQTWSYLPTFAWRRVGAAKPISLMEIPAYDERSRMAHQLYERADAEAAARTARQLGVDYIFIGPVEQAANQPDQLAKFDSRPDLFRLVFSNTSTRIYQVQ
jgi:FtsH-binding integral membrane protein